MMGSLKVVGADGRVGANAKATDLTDGVTVSCTYSVHHGNPGNLVSAGRFGRRGMGGLGMWGMMMAMGHRGRGGYDSDDY